MRYTVTAIRQYLLEQTKSSQSVADFCGEHGLKVATFYSWRRKYSHSREAEAAGFCKIVTASQTVGKSLQLPSGLRLELTGLSTAELADLIVAIERAHA